MPTSPPDGAEKHKIPHTRAPWGHVAKHDGSFAHFTIVSGMSYKPKSGDAEK